MRLLHRRILAAVALGQFMLLGWDLSSQIWYVWPFASDPGTWGYIFWVPMSFYVCAGALVMWIVTGDGSL